MRRATWWRVCVLCTVACGEPEMLGENDCGSDQTQCDGGTFVYVTQSNAPAHRFDLEAKERLPAAWTFPLDVHMASSAFIDEVVDVEPAPDGGVWVLQSHDPTRNLLRLDAAGKELAAFALPPSSPTDIALARLTVSSMRQPVVDMVFGKAGSPHVQGGYVLRQEATPTALNQTIVDMDPVSVTAGPDDHLVVVTAHQNTHLTVQELTRDGAPIWQTTVPYPKGFRRTQMVGWSRYDVQVMRAENGATLLYWPAAQTTTPDTFTHLLTMIDPAGHVKWQTQIREWTEVFKFAGLNPAGCVVSTSLSSPSRILAVSEEGTVMDQWSAEPTAYHGRRVDAITSDAAGNVYLGLTTGLRPSPQVTVCKLSTSDANVSPRCIDLDLEPGLALAEVDDITSPAPNRVVVAFHTGTDEKHPSWRVSGLSF